MKKLIGNQLTQTQASSPDTPLWAVIAHVKSGEQKRDIVEFLLVKGAEVSPILLRVALEKQDITTAQLLLDRGVSVNDRGYEKSTLLMDVIRWNTAPAATRRELVKLLLTHGAEVNAQDVQGRTALSLATQQGDSEMQELLKQHGAKD
ncbi:MAG: ankyrin repeat domain-containing protein [Oculatellaceae cyanobacterium Prado106]|jgi:ankyrin repeat protein|nr:ankyrin repeat domain-containing protein [Oculatellaceae cyanobacterium Prado106]